MQVNDVDYRELPTPSEGAAPVLAPNLDMLKHVSVSLEVKVGNAVLSVADLFNLKQGGVVVLDRRVDEPVELLLNGKAIASGHLAVAGDNLGIRITSIHNTDTQISL